MYQCSLIASHTDGEALHVWMVVMWQGKALLLWMALHLDYLTLQVTVGKEIIHCNHSHLPSGVCPWSHISTLFVYDHISCVGNREHHGARSHKEDCITGHFVHECHIPLLLVHACNAYTSKHAHVWCIHMYECTCKDTQQASTKICCTVCAHSRHNAFCASECQWYAAPPPPPTG